MQQMCAFSGRPICAQCSGAVYRCDPQKNKECTKESCGECQYTSNIDFAQDPRPICRRAADEKMLVPKQRWDDLEKRIRNLENGNIMIRTAEHGKHTLRWYIRMLSHFTKVDAGKMLESWGK